MAREFYDESDYQLISVIVPVYNVEDYIENCLLSILSQDYPHFEVIIINDGSTDSSLLRAEKYLSKSKNLKIVSTLNRGLSAARNLGISLAKGEYICFVDSDDYISSNMLSNLYSRVLRDGTSLAICEFTEIEDLTQTTRIGNTLNDSVLDYKELLYRMHQKNGYHIIVAWNKLYHKDLFSDLLFPEGKIHEDEFIILDVLKKAGKISLLSDNLYFYRVKRAGSIMSKTNIKSELDKIEAYIYRAEQLEKYGLNEFVFNEKSTALYYIKIFISRPELYNAYSRQEINLLMNRYKNIREKDIREYYRYMLLKINILLRSLLN